MARAPKATVSDQSSTPKRCFVITPIGVEGSEERKHADWVFYHVIKPTLEARSYRVDRADLFEDPSMITDKIFEAVINWELCIVDLSFSNCNVHYELGVRHALGKAVIHIAKEGTRLPFDNSGHRAEFFDPTVWQSMEKLRDNLEKMVAATEEPDFRPSNPLTQAKGRLELSESTDSRDQLISQLSGRVHQLERTLQQGQSLRPKSAGLAAAFRQAASTKPRHAELLIDSITEKWLSSPEPLITVDPAWFLDRVDIKNWSNSDFEYAEKEVRDHSGIVNKEELLAILARRHTDWLFS